MVEKGQNRTEPCARLIFQLDLFIFQGRTQTICTHSNRSSRRSLLFGVPQGSVAGPVAALQQVMPGQMTW